MPILLKAKKETPQYRFVMLINEFYTSSLTLKLLMTQKLNKNDVTMMTTMLIKLNMGDITYYDITYHGLYLHVTY